MVDFWLRWGWVEEKPLTAVLWTTGNGPRAFAPDFLCEVLVGASGVNAERLWPGRMEIQGQRWAADDEEQGGDSLRKGDVAVELVRRNQLPLAPIPILEHLG